MSHTLISLNSDLSKLAEDGYNISITNNYLVIDDVPYVGADKKVKRGRLVSEISIAGDKTVKPKNHQASFCGEYPCDADGNPLEIFRHGSKQQDLGGGLTVDHSFSCKPPDGYKDHHHKMLSYIARISGPAEKLDPKAKARTKTVKLPEEPEAVFNYIDNATTRAGISALTEKLALDKVAIIGLGGTGAYILDLIAKTPIREIHLIDADEFEQHSAFRAPGAASIDELRVIPDKVDYWSEKYLVMRKRIIPHVVYVDENTINILDDMKFVFISIDDGYAKRLIIEHLEKLGIPFIDVGMGIQSIDDKYLMGAIRVTVSTPEHRNHIHEKKRISLSEPANDEYSTNIQTADLNMLNAALAVLKWKKLMGFYHDQENEYHSIYRICGNIIINDDQS